MATSLVIHGHFYQPPRENPWTGMVEREPSAAPAHDWNERIQGECYRPNAFARVVDGHGRVARIVNNYAHINFNFGPTLLSWMEEHGPDAYRRILEADRESLGRFGGHGSAIAQGYNHAILPLCNEHDRITQIVWGLEDFRHRLGRSAEALWLPETACNDACLGALMDQGMKYAILSPYQAERVRPLGNGDWTSVAEGSVDPGQAYRYLHRDGSGRSIALFFYDGPLSRSIAFEGALYSSQTFLDRFAHVGGRDGRLVSVATDGETYGHHSHFGDRTLAYALEMEAAQRGFALTNYGQYLEQHPPTHEAEIKPGPNGEGTSWSCAHGVGRWYRDCGCSTGGQEGWNQAWRAPLRQALDFLRDAAAVPFEESRGRLFKDPWDARNGYISVVLGKGQGRDEFLGRFGARELDAEERVRALALLELQRQCLLMYTSCGWFFSDIAGLEAVQVLKYAGRAIDLMVELGLASPRERFLEILSQAVSNEPSKGNGADIFRREVDPMRMTPERFAAHLAISGLLDEEGESGDVSGFHFSRHETRKEQLGRVTLATGQLKLESSATGRLYAFMHAALYIGGVDFYCVLRPMAGPKRFRAAVAKTWEHFASGSLLTLLRLIQEEFGPEEFGLQHALPRSRQRILEQVFGSMIGHYYEQYARLYDDNRRIMDHLQQSGFQLPRELTAAAEFTLAYRFEQEVLRQQGSMDPQAYGKARELALEAQRRGCAVERPSVNRAFEEKVTALVRRVAEDPQDDTVRGALAMLELCREMRLAPRLDLAQEAFFEALPPRKAVTGLMAQLALALGLVVPATSETGV